MNHTVFNKLEVQKAVQILVLNTERGRARDSRGNVCFTHKKYRDDFMSCDERSRQEAFRIFFNDPLIEIDV